MTQNEIAQLVQRVKSNIRVTKVVATRSIKGKFGDNYVGFSAAWNTVQDDTGGGIESILDDAAEAQSGMTLREARVAHLLVALQVDLSAYDAALASGNITSTFHAQAVKGVRVNYNRMIQELLAKAEAPTDSK